METADCPLVSAIVLTHARRELVQRAIDSVQAQTYPHMELIVVDDASSDGTKELLEERAAREGFRYVYIPAAESRGGNYARNRGLSLSRGAFVAFLDDDDEWMPEKTEKQLAYLQEHPDCGVVSCLRVFETNFDTRVPEPRESQIEGDLSQAIFTCIPSVTSMLLFRREVFDACGPFDEALRYWQEYELALRYTQVTQVGCVYEHLCLYRIVLGDKARLTNRLDGWLDAVAYIERKHAERIAALPQEVRVQHQLLIAKDGFSRAKNAGDRKRARAFLRQMFFLDPSPRSFVKLLLGPRGIELLKSFGLS